MIDFCIVFTVLLIIWPVLLAITILLHFANKGAGAIFFQERPGKDGKIFKVIKFINLPYSEKIDMGIAGRRKMENEFDRKIIISAYLNQLDLLNNSK